MTYRELLEKMEMVATMQPSLLNKTVICSLDDNEFFVAENIIMEKFGNEFVEKDQPIITLFS